MSEKHHCLVCDEMFAHGKTLSIHIKNTHSLSPIDYVVKYMYDAKQPECPTCGSETRFKGLSKGFATYCAAHASQAMKIGGAKGGKNRSVNLSKNPPVPCVNVSAPEGSFVELTSFIEELGVKYMLNAPDVIDDHRFDMWLPDHNVAIMLHSLSSDRQVNKNSNREMYVRCNESSIRLIQFFSDEWSEKTKICKSIILNALKLVKNKIDACDCIIKVISTKETKPFLNDNHVAGQTKARLHVGLYHPDHGLVSVSTVRVPIQKKWGKVTELARMASKVNFVVRGAASKMLKYITTWSKDMGYEGLLSYAELRYGTGGVYGLCGLTLQATAKNNYWYTDGNVRYNRFKFRAQPGKTEKDVAVENNVHPVWGCGNNVYLIKF